MTQNTASVHFQLVPHSWTNFLEEFLVGHELKLVTHTSPLKIECLVKIARIGTLMIPGRQKVAELYHDNTMIILVS
jgi:hypothetical protein